MQQPQPNPGLESNAEISQKTEESPIDDNNRLPERQLQNTVPWVPVSCQEPCPLSDKKCPIHSSTQKKSSERKPESNQQGNSTQENLSEYKTGISEQRVMPTVDNAAKSALVSEPYKTDQISNLSNQTKNQQPVLKNGLFAQNLQRGCTLPKDRVNEDLDTVNNFELEALEKMVDHDLQSLVSGTSAEENTTVINKDLRNKVLSEEFQRKIDKFLNDIWIYVCMYVCMYVCIKVKLATIVEGNPKAPFSIATSPKCRGGRYSMYVYTHKREKKSNQHTHV